MDNIKVNMGGDELDLVPLNARQYLSARMEADALSESFGDDEVSKAVLLGAGLLSKCLFRDGERLFMSAQNVLDSMSAEEIIHIAGYVDLETDTKERIVETVVRLKKIRDDDANVDFAPAVQSLNSDDLAMMDVNTQVLRDFHSGAQSEEPFSYSPVQEYGSSLISNSLSPQNSMRRVSDFFQRDSRRYDGIISSY